MIKGNWSVGVIVDERATAEQRDAIIAIASGSWSVTAGTLVDMAAQGAMGLNPNATEPLQMENTGHPAADRFTLARALRTHVDALGLSLHETSGRNNDQYAPLSWRSA